MIFTSSYFVNEGFSQTREEIANGSARMMIDPSSRSPGSEKINHMLIQWQSSLNPQFFAEQNNLRTSEDKVSVYIYLDSYESVSKLATEIDLLSSSDNIAVAYVDGRQLTQLSQLDYVQRIDLPISASFMEKDLRKTIPDDYSVKISESIQEWQSSSDPTSFATENNLEYSDGKIRVYIYLDSYESVTNLPNDIDFLVSSDNIVVAFLDSQEINQITKLDFVQRIELPVSGTFGPPQIADTESIDEIFLYSITAIIIAAVVSGIVVVSRRRKIAKKF